MNRKAADPVSRTHVALNVVIAVVGFGAFARLSRFPLGAFSATQTFFLGFGLGLITSGAVLLQLRPSRPLIGILQGCAGLLAFAASLLWM